MCDRNEEGYGKVSNVLGGRFQAWRLPGIGCSVSGALQNPPAMSRSV